MPDDVTTEDREWVVLVYDLSRPGRYRECTVSVTPDVPWDTVFRDVGMAAKNALFSLEKGEIVPHQEDSDA